MNEAIGRRDSKEGKSIHFVTSDFPTDGDDGEWRGLGKCSKSTALICDTPSSGIKRWMCVGCKAHTLSGNGIPGPKSAGNVTKVELYVGIKSSTRMTTLGETFPFSSS